MCKGNTLVVRSLPGRVCHSSIKAPRLSQFSNHPFFSRPPLLLPSTPSSPVHPFFSRPPLLLPSTPSSPVHPYFFSFVCFLCSVFIHSFSLTDFHPMLAGPFDCFFPHPFDFIHSFSLTGFHPMFTGPFDFLFSASYRNIVRKSD